MSASEQDVELAILSMDAYNEGYSPGMSLPNTTPIGGARRSADSTAVLGVDANGVPVDQSATFYAVAYQWQGETIISYRGTQLSTLSSTLGDVLNGWTVGLGFAAASQAQFAMQFYTDVTGAPVGAVTPPSNVVLTGHSLGGGLAAFVADLTGARADVFDNIPFGVAVDDEIDYENLIDGLNGLPGNAPYPTSSSNITQFAISGEVAEYFRDASGNPLDLSFSPASETLSAYASLSDPITLHSQALLVLETYADVNGFTAWQSEGQALYNAEFDEAIAKSVGITDTGG